MSDKKITRRKMLAGSAAFSGFLLTGCDTSTYLPPHRKPGLGGIAEMLNMASHRLFMTDDSIEPEYDRSDITPHFPVEGTAFPEDDNYQRQLLGGFDEWRLSVTGLVNRPLSLSLEDLKRMPRRDQITSHSCEKGWTAIAEWSGVQLSRILELAGGIKPGGKYVSFRTVDGWENSVDMFDALHQQTILAYGMNGKELPVQHGAPLRLRVERHVGYKNLKYLSSIEVIEKPGGPGKSGWHWYTGA